MKLTEKQIELLAKFLVISNIGKSNDQPLTTPREIESAYGNWNAEYAEHFGSGLQQDYIGFVRSINEGKFIDRIQEEIPFILNDFKPTVKLVGEDGNVFNIIGKVAKALERIGQKSRAEKFKKEAMSSESYGAVLVLAYGYVEVE